MSQKVSVFSKIKDVYSKEKCEDVTTYVSTKEKAKDISLAEKYYDLVTDFYEYGWGKWFHFTYQNEGEKIEEAMKRHELFIAKALKLKKGMKVLDVGCGVGGPMKNIAEFSGANIVGLNINAYQIKKAKAYVRKNGLEEICSFHEGNFMQVGLPDESFDAIYAIEATPHAPDRVKCFKEMYRLLKPGGYFSGYEYALLDNFDENNPRHVKIVEDLEYGGGMQKVPDKKEMKENFIKAGFQIKEFRDVFENAPSWTEYLEKKSGKTHLTKFLHICFVRALELLRIAPKGSAAVSRFLNLAANGFIAAKKYELFTPGLFFLVQKPR